MPIWMVLVVRMALCLVFLLAAWQDFASKDRLGAGFALLSSFFVFFISFQFIPEATRGMSALFIGLYVANKVYRQFKTSRG